MKKRFLLFALALLTAVPSWCDMVLIDDEEGINEYTDPVTKVVYTYDPETLTAEVKRGDVLAPDDGGEMSFLLVLLTRKDISTSLINSRLTVRSTR